MSATLVARAPGKLFVMGEYAVLDGCPAIVAAIDRHVEVRLRRAGGTPVFRITAPGHGAVDFPVTHPPRIDGPLRFVVAAVAAVLARCPDLRRSGWSLTTTSTMDVCDGVKVGVGSSAAVTVASVAVLLAATETQSDRDDLFAIALAAHRAGQGGVGSGGDVAASVYGGVTLLQPPTQLLPLVTPLSLPAHTQLLAAWSGESASTPGLVQQYLGATNGAAAARAAFVDASRACVNAFVRALSLGVLAHSAIEANAAALERLGRDLGLPIVTPRLAQMIAVARAYGVAAKTSGAGSGDCGIALTCDVATAESVRQAWRAMQLMPLDLALEPKGVTVARG